MIQPSMMKYELLAIVVAFSFNLYAQQHEVPIYPGTAPGSETWTWNEEKHFVKVPINGTVIYNISRPSLSVFLPNEGSATGTSVLLLPGGGFHFINYEHEGTRVAQSLNEKGITVFLLKYRVARTLTDDPFSELMRVMNQPGFDTLIAPVKKLALDDAETAMQYIRQKAGTYNIDPKKIGVIGFSAGGSLAIRLAGAGQPPYRPDFVAMIYTVFNPDTDKLLPRIPPAFIAGASDDKLAAPLHSINIYNSWIGSGAAAELHIYASGGHGLKTGNAPTWISRFIEWMQQQGF